MKPTPYPLCWPLGHKRTRFPERSRFDISFDRARKALRLELDRLGATDVILSTNLKLRIDGEPYANSKPDDGDIGIAVYFSLDKQPTVLCCDHWDTMADNMQAIAKTVDAMRGIDRWRCSDMLRRMFSGFEALAESSDLDPYKILGIEKGASADQIKAAYRKKTLETHPDRNEGKVDAYHLVQRAYDELTKS